MFIKIGIVKVKGYKLFDLYTDDGDKVYILYWRRHSHVNL